MSVYRDWRTLREIDLAGACPKGTAFRAFKQQAEHWQEGREFIVLDPDQASEAIAQMRGEGRLYAGSVKAILLSRRAADTLIDQLAGQLRLPR